VFWPISTDPELLTLALVTGSMKGDTSLKVVQKNQGAREWQLVRDILISRPYNHIIGAARDLLWTRNATPRRSGLL
jgi:hypothetical protein